MKKLSYIVTIFVAMVFLSVSTTFASSKVVTLQPGWNTFSTPKVLSAITFSNGNGAGLLFYKLDNGNWSSIQANTTNIKPLEGFVVNNTNTGSVQVGLDYATNLAPAEMLFQKVLSAGWNMLGITSITNPFTTMGTNATMSVDFTRTSGGSNLTNGVNSTFSTTSGEANIANPELGEAYAVFAQSSGVYGGNQDPADLDLGDLFGTGSASTLALNRTDGFSDTNLVSGSKGVTVYGAQFSASWGTSISLSNFSVVTTGTANSYTGGNTALTLYVDGVAKSTKNLTTTGVTFDWFNSTVSTSTGVDITIKADFSDITTSGTFRIASIAYDAVDTITSQSISSKPSATGVVFTIVQPIGTLAASTGDTLVNRALLLAGSSTQKISSFKVTASNDVIKLKDITLTGANLDALSNIRLTDSVGTVLGTASNVTATGATFANLDSAAGSSIAMDHSATFYVVADINSSTNQTDVYANVTVAGSNITGSNGGVVAMTGSNVAGASHDIATNTLKVTLGTPTSKSLATDAMEFTVTAFGMNSVTLSGATFNNVLSGYTGSMVLTVVRKSDNATVGSVSGTTGAISFTANNSIDAGTSVVYIVKMVGALVDSGSNSQDWTVSLTGLTTTTSLDAANYPKNTDTFPLTSNK